MAEIRGRSWRATRAVAGWARRHLALWMLAAGAIDTALVALVAVLIAFPGQSGNAISSLIAAFIVLLSLSVAFPVAGRMVDERDQAVGQDRERRNHADTLLVRGSIKRLPRLSDLADDALGVTPTRYSIDGHAPYVARPDADEKIRSLIAAPRPPYPFLIVWGTTKAGKSRTLAEALREGFTHDPVVIVPRDGQALAELARLKIDRLLDNQPAVVVLDDLDPAGLEMLTADVLAEVRGWAVIVATMTAQRRAAVLATGGEVGATARAALASTSGEYELPSEPPTGAERGEAERLYPAEDFDGSIAETLVGARELIARYKASYDTNPAGCAVVRAAIDARRAGVSRPVTESVLRGLFPLYLRSVRVGLTPTDEQFIAGIEWATRPVASQVALLRLASPPGQPNAWTIFDHAVTADEGQNGHQRPIPAETWDKLIELLPIGDALGVGFTAGLADNRKTRDGALRKAVVSGVLSEIPILALTVGALLKNRDMDYARIALRQAADSSDADAASIARISLGDIFKQTGDIDGARAEYQRAIDSGKPAVVALANICLGDLLAELGDIDGARAAYQQTIDNRDALSTPLATTKLRNLPDRRSDTDGSDDVLCRGEHTDPIGQSHTDPHS
jgi:hypothetical protein